MATNAIVYMVRASKKSSEAETMLLTRGAAKNKAGLLLNLLNVQHTLALYQISDSMCWATAHIATLFIYIPASFGLFL